MNMFTRIEQSLAVCALGAVAVLTLTAPVQAGTVAHWRFEASRDSSTNAASLVYDPATPSGGMTYSSDTLGDLRLSAGAPTLNTNSFNVATQGNALQVGNWSALNDVMTKGSFTIEALVKVDSSSASDYDAIFHHRLGVGVTNGCIFGFSGEGQTHRIRFIGYEASAGFAQKIALAADQVPSGEWVHVAAVGTYANNGAGPDTVSVQMYVNHVANGSPMVYTGIDGKALKQQDSVMHIGYSSVAGCGLIDELRISNVALVPEEFIRPYNHEFIDADTVAHWRFEGFRDSSTNAAFLVFDPATPSGGMTYSTNTIGTLRLSDGAPTLNRKSFQLGSAGTWLKVSNWSALDDVMTKGSFTIEAFINAAPSPANDYDAILNHRIDSADGWFFTFDASTQKIRFGADQASDSTLKIATMTDPVPAGEWVHVAAVGTYADNGAGADTVSIQLYMNYVTNGSPVVCTGVDGQALQEVTGAYYIGRNYLGGGGLIDELRIRGVALTPSEFLVRCPRGTVVLVK